MSRLAVGWDVFFLVVFFLAKNLGYNQNKRDCKAFEKSCTKMYEQRSMIFLIIKAFLCSCSINSHF